MTEPAVELRKLHRSYGTGSSEVHALRGADLTVDAGELVALTGPSGSGKTTLLNCLLGLDQADQGTIRVFDSDVRALSYEQAVEWRRRDVAIVFQTTGLLPHLSARENVDAVLRIRGVPRTERLRRIDDIFEDLGLDSLGDHLPGELSGGQRQRVSIARALATRPRLLVADEPTGELDTDTRLTALEVLRSGAREHEITMLMATHDPDVEAIADRTLRMIDGQVR